MIEYRPFRNADPPQLVDLWRFGRLGPGAAADFSNDAFDMLVLSEPYFDPGGLIVACDGSEIVGYVHAGFGENEAGTGLSKDAGVIAAIIVRFDYRRQGIGRELIARAEAYLRKQGAGRIFAGESEGRDPFYLGLYGGANAAGFLESDPNAGPFFAALGYVPAERFVLLSRDISEKKDPFEPRALAIKRAMRFGILDHPSGATWWWMTRYGRFDSLSFALVPNAGGPPPAQVTAWGMELHSASRGERTVGLVELAVSAGQRRKGYARVLVAEVIRRLREERVTQVEVALQESDAPSLALFGGLGFVPFDHGVVYRRPDESERQNATA